MRALQINQSITSRDEDSLRRYLYDLDKTPLLKAEEEVALARKIKTGDQSALDKLVKSNLRFVVSCAKKYQHMGMPLNDLINEGNIGLIKAAKLFDETKGFKFISYAVWWIRQSMMAALGMDIRMIRLPMNMVRATIQLKKTNESLLQELEREPTLEEMAECLSTTSENLALQVAYGKTVVSLDSPLQVDDQQEVWSAIEDPNSVPTDAGLIKQADRSFIDSLLSVVSSRDQKILKELYGLNFEEEKSMDEVGKLNNLTAESIRQIRLRAIDKMKAAAAHKNLNHQF